MGERRQSEVGSVVSHATANTTASRSAPAVHFAPLLTAYHPSTQLPPPPHPRTYQCIKIASTLEEVYATVPNLFQHHQQKQEQAVSAAA